MGLQAEEAVDNGVVSFTLQQADREEFSLGFGHFARFRIQMVYMEPVFAPLMPQIGFALGDLIGYDGERRCQGRRSADPDPRPGISC